MLSLDIQMSSVSSRFSQRLTRTLKVGETAAYLYPQSEIDFWYAANKSVITKLGNNYVLSAADLSTILENLDNDGNRPPASTSLKDLGREIKIGTTTESALIVLRLVQLPGLVASNGTPANYDTVDTGYVVVANNTTDAVHSDSTNGLRVYVSRV